MAGDAEEVLMGEHGISCCFLLRGLSGVLARNLLGDIMLGGGSSVSSVAAGAAIIFLEKKLEKLLVNVATGIAFDMRCGMNMLRYMEFVLVYKRGCIGWCCSSC